MADGADSPVTVVQGGDSDPAVLTVLGEAGADPQGQQAVASTIVNRMHQTGATSPDEVVVDPANGYESWQSRSSQLLQQYPAGSPAYEAAVKNVGAILSGQQKAPYDYTSYYSPKSQAAMGRQPPAWDDGSGTDIGGNRFFNRPVGNAPPSSEVVADLLSSRSAQGAGATPNAPSGNAPISSAEVVGDLLKSQSPQGNEAPATAAGVAAQGARGLLGSIEDAARDVTGIANLGDFAKWGAQTIEGQVGNIASLLGEAAGTDGTPKLTQPTAPQGGPPTPDLDRWIAEQPANAAERVARLGGSLATGAALGPEGEASALANVGVRAKNVIAPLATGAVAGEAVHAMGGSPNEVSGAQTLGTFPGSIIGAPNAFRGLALATDHAISPILADLLPSVAEKRAGQTLANAAGEGFDTARHALSDYVDLVPGSPATVGDVTGNLGLINLSRQAATKGSTAYADLTERQATARQASLQSLSPNADPQAVQAHLRGTLDALDAQTAGDVESARQQAQAAAQGVGGTGNPEDYGASVRSAVQSALDASKARTDSLYAAVDPDGTLTGNVASTRVAAKTIAGSVSPLATPMNADEARIFAQAQALPTVAPLKDILAFKAAINEAAANADAAGNRAAYGRLSALRGALNENLATTIGDAVQDPNRAAKVAAWEHGQQQPTSVAASGGPAGAGGSDQQLAGGGTLGQAGVGGAAFPQAGGPGRVAGSAGLPPQVSPDLKPIVMGGQTVGYTTPTGETISAAAARQWQGAPAPATPAPASANPTVDAEGVGRLRAADAAYAQQAQTYDARPVGPTLTTNGYRGQYQLADGAVPEKFFHTGPTAYSDMQALAKASPEAILAIQDYAAATLRKAALGPDGTIDPGKFAAWQKNYGDAIRALPADQQAGFANAAAASETVARAEALRKSALDAAQTGAIGRIIGAQSPEEVMNSVGRILRSPTAVSDIASLVAATRNNPDALAGLKQAALDHITSTLTSNAEAGASGVNKLKADAYQTFIKQASPALSKLFTPPEMQRLTAIAQDIQQSQRTLNATKLAGQSNTRQDLYAGGLPQGGAGARTVLDILATAFAGAGAAALHANPVLAGAVGAAGGGVTELIQHLRAAGISKVNDLVSRAVFEPKVAAALMAKVKGPQDAAAQGTAGRALLRALFAPAAATVSGPPQPSQPRTALSGVYNPPPQPTPNALAGAF